MFGEFARLHEFLIKDPRQPEAYHAAFKMLCTIGIEEATKLQKHCSAGGVLSELVNLLIHQESCPERPRILHHGIASLLTSQNVATARVVVATCVSALRAFTSSKDEAQSGLALFFAVAREVLPDDGPTQKEVSDLHLAQFPSFTAHDLALPYSVKFNESFFGANCKDLLGKYPSAVSAMESKEALGIRHLLLLERLSTRPLFRSTEEIDSLRKFIEFRISKSHATQHESDEKAAARALFLRYSSELGVLGAEKLDALGLEQSLIKRASELPRPIARPEEFGVSLDRRLSKAFHAGLNTVAPQLAKIGERPRVALCVSGQMRGFRVALESWRRVLLPFVKPDIYIHTWANIGRASPQPFRAYLPFEGARFCEEWRRVGMLEGYEKMQERYPHLFQALETSAHIEAETLMDLYETTNVVVEDDRDERFASFSNQDKMHYKINAAHKLATESKEDYDLIMRIRPDLELVVAGFSWRSLHHACAQAPVIYTDGAYGLHYYSLVIGDQLAIGSPDVMAIYSATYNESDCNAIFDISGFPKELTGHASLAQTCWLSGIDVKKLPLKVGELLEMENLPIEHVLTAIEADAEGRFDDVDRQLIDTARADLKA